MATRKYIDGIVIHPKSVDKLRGSTDIQGRDRLRVASIHGVMESTHFSRSTANPIEGAIESRGDPGTNGDVVTCARIPVSINEHHVDSVDTWKEVGDPVFSLGIGFDLEDARESVTLDRNAEPLKRFYFST